MKCDELKPIELECNMGKDINGVEHREPWKAYDIDEVDAAIAELKDKVKLCSDFELAARKDIEEMREQHQMLKQFGHYKLSPVPGEMINHEVRQYVSYNVVCMIINHLESENAELKQKLEDAKATAYAESVDAGMENRKLKRALWLARAERAIAEAEYWYGHCSGMFYIDATEVPDEEDDPYKRVKDTTMGWYKTWMNVERKCRAKAEEYK